MPVLFFLNRETKETRKETRDGSLSPHLGERRQRTVPCLLSPLVSLSPFLCRLADRRVRIPIVFLNLCDHIYTGLEETSANRSQPSTTNKHAPLYRVCPEKQMLSLAHSFCLHSFCLHSFRTRRSTKARGQESARKTTT